MGHLEINFSKFTLNIKVMSSASDSCLDKKNANVNGRIAHHETYILVYLYNMYGTLNVWNTHVNVCWTPWNYL